MSTRESPSRMYCAIDGVDLAESAGTGFLVATTVMRVMACGLLDREARCKRTSRALVALALATD